MSEPRVARRQLRLCSDQTPSGFGRLLERFSTLGPIVHTRQFGYAICRRLAFVLSMTRCLGRGLVSLQRSLVL